LLQAAQGLKDLVVPVLFLMIYVMIVPMDFKALADVRKYKKEILLGIFTIMILAPLIACFINFILPSEYDYLKFGLILATTMPPGGMIVSWTGLLDANIELAMLLQTITFVLAIVSIPLTLSLLVSGQANFSQTLLIENIVLYIFLPLIAGFLTQLALKRRFPDEKLNLGSQL